MKVARGLLLAVIVSLAAASVASAKSPDPRVCSLTRPSAAETAAVCSRQAATLALRRAVTARINARVLWDNQIACVSQGTLLKYRCQWFGSPKPAALVAWDPVSFAPAVTFGPVGLAFLTEAKNHLAAGMG